MTSIEPCRRTLERREAAKRAHNRTLWERARGDAERIVTAYCRISLGFWGGWKRENERQLLFFTALRKMERMEDWGGLRHLLFVVTARRHLASF
jgi:hypothetical protein